MDLLLDEVEVRILGCLIEKQLATPEYYPLSLNALVNACNQKTNREPVTNYEEEQILSALDHLVEKKVVNCSMVGRVPKYEELFLGAYNMVPKEGALLGVLLLRGPQTMGELRSRAARMAEFESVEAVQETLNTLSEWAMAYRLERRPGHKESRYIHLLSGPVDESMEAATQTAPVFQKADRLAELENDVEKIKHALNTLKEEFDNFKKMLE